VADIEIDDVEDALRRADELAELTGRMKKDVIADLLDDGQLNYSAGEDAKETADIFDIAQEKAEKLKALIITMIPIIALVLGGGGLEMLGITNMTGSDDDDHDDHNPDPIVIPDIVVWGCTDPAATNYEDWATDDDESCDYPEPVEELDLQSLHLSLVGDNELKVEFDLYVEGDFCCDDIELVWEIEVNGFYDDGLRKNTQHSYDEEGHHHFENYWPDMGEGNYHARVEVKWMNDIRDQETSNGVTIECSDEDDDGICDNEEVAGCTDDSATNYDDQATDDDGSCEYPPPPECEVEIINHFRGHVQNDPEQDAVLVAFKIVPTDCEGRDIEVDVELYQTGYDANYSWGQILNGDDEHEISHAFDDIVPGEWIPKVTVYDEDNNEELESIEMWGIVIEEEEVIECVIEFYDYQLYYIDNQTNLTVYFDPDEVNGCGETVLIEVEFSWYEANSTNRISDNASFYNITGEEWDQLTLSSNGTLNGTYDFRIRVYKIDAEGQRLTPACISFLWEDIEVNRE
jgi:hypothetical protein